MTCAHLRDERVLQRHRESCAQERDVKAPPRHLNLVAPIAPCRRDCVQPAARPAPRLGRDVDLLTLERGTHAARPAAQANGESRKRGRARQLAVARWSCSPRNLPGAEPLGPAQGRQRTVPSRLVTARNLLAPLCEEPAGTADALRRGGNLRRLAAPAATPGALRRRWQPPTFLLGPAGKAVASCGPCGPSRRGS